MDSPLAHAQVSPYRRYGWLAIRLAFVSAILYLILSRIDLATFAASLRAVDIGYLLIGFGFWLLALTLATIRWKILLDVLSGGISLMSLLAFQLVGVFYNQFLPGNITGDVVKGYYMARTAADKVSIYTSVLFDRLLGILVTGLLGVFALLGNDTLLAALDMNRHLPDVLLAITLTGLAVGYGVFRLAGRWRARFPAVVAEAYRAVAFYLDHPLVIVRAVLVSLIYFVVWSAGLWFVARSLHLYGLDPASLLLVLAVVNLAQVIPFSINGWGIREGALILLLAAYGIGSEQALLFSLLIAGLNLFTAVGGGALVLIDYRS